MSRLPSRKSLAHLLLIAAGVVVVVLAARGMFELSSDARREADDLGRQLDTARAPSFEKRLELKMALMQYETDSRIKIWTGAIQAAGGAALLLGLVFTARNLRATQEKLDIDRQGQLTNRFIQATSQHLTGLAEGLLADRRYPHGLRAAQRGVEGACDRAAEGKRNRHPGSPDRPGPQSAARWIRRAPEARPTVH
jgi:hypothetical protein